MNQEVALILSIVTALGSAATFLAFWMKLSERITRAENEGQNALQEAAESRKENEELHRSFSLLSTAMSIHREGIAKDYIDKDMLKEMRAEMMTVVNSINNKIDILTQTVTDLRIAQASNGNERK